VSGAGRPPRVQPQSPENAPRATEPYGSIVERFRGTEWDTRPSPEPPRSPLSGILVVVGAVALLVIGVFVVVAVLSRPPTAVVTPSRFIATPQPTPGPADLLLSAFWSEINGPDFGYHLEIKASVRQAADRLDETVSLDAHADDFSGSGVIVIKGYLKPVQVVFLRSGGVMYLKLDGDKTWNEALSASELELSMRPLLNLEDERQLIVSGTASRSGVTLERLVSTPLYRPPVTRLIPLGIGSVPPGPVQLELLVNDAGIPVEATLTVHIPADPANGTPAVDGTATYTFTNVDQVGPIATPHL
jgi:hypothetical protein